MRDVLAFKDGNRRRVVGREQNELSERHCEVRDLFVSQVSNVCS